MTGWLTGSCTFVDGWHRLFAAVDQVLPVTLVEILENRSPRYRLHVANYCGRLAIEHESVHFLKTANLCSLQIRAPSNIKGSPAYMAELQSLKKVIMSASNLRVLDVHMLDVHAVFGGLLNSVNAIPPGIFQFEKGDRFPPLEELSLYCYSHCFSIENWAAWFACMDWTQLRRLNFGISYQASFMKYFKGKLPDLRSFKTGLHAVEEVEGLDGFLTALDQLEDLDIRSFIAKPLFSQLALARHGSCSLRHLSYLSPIIFDMSKPCRFISTDQLDELNKQCPKLESLEIDLRIDQGWPDSIMSSLARFACLHHLRVRFDMPATKGQLDLRKSTLIAKSLFAFTRQEKIGVPLLTMVSIVRLEGNHRDIQNECSRDQLRRILATIRCKVVQRDDGIESTIVKSWKGFIGRHSMR